MSDLKKFFVLALFATILCGGSISYAHENHSSDKSFSECAVEHPGSRSGFKQAYCAVVINCKESITLRSEPSAYSEELAQIPLGAQLTIYDALPEDGFLPAEYNGTLGWVLKEYIRIVGAA